MRFFDSSQDVQGLRREIERAFDSFRGTPAARNLFLPGRNPRSYPLVNIAENSDQVFVEALAPGLDPEKIEITVLGNQLTISGEKPHQEGVSAEKFHRSERATGKFVRTFSLPTEVNEDGVEATYVAGVLSITLAKSEAAKPRKIAVTVAR